MPTAMLAMDNQNDELDKRFANMTVNGDTDQNHQQQSRSRCKYSLKLVPLDAL